MHRPAEPPALNAEPAVPPNMQAARWLALGAIAGPVVFTLAWFILGFLSPGFTISGDRIEPYSIVAHPISGLGMGVTAPYMNTGIILGGLLTLAGVVGVFHTMKADGRPAARRACTALLALSPLGLVIAGIFDFESILHWIGFGLFVTPVLTFLVVGWYFLGIPRWRRFGTLLLLGSPLTLVVMLLFVLSFDQEAAGDGQGIAGLTGRLLPTVLLAWFAVMGWLAFRQHRNPGPSPEYVPTRGRPGPE